MDGRPAGDSDCESDDYFMDDEVPGPLPTIRSRPNNNLIQKVFKTNYVYSAQYIILIFSGLVTTL